MWNFIVTFIICIILPIDYSTGMCSNAYGAEPCQYVPAPPGHTPPCAKPGDTFCEQVDYYPMQHILYLINQWGYDYATLFNDETRDEYSSYFTHPDYHHYKGPPAHSNGYNYPSPEPIYIPKPPPGAPQYPHPGNKYIPPPVNAKSNYSNTFAGYPDRRQPIKYPNHNIAPPGNHIGNHNPYHGRAHHNYFVPSIGPNGYNSGYYGNPGVSYYDQNYWNRNNKNLGPRIRRSTTNEQKSSKKGNLKIKKKKNHVYDTNKNITVAISDKKQRNKRQAPLSGEQQLCATRSQFIMPRAALNNKGNWMYVVNLPDQDTRYTQLVRTETCVSQQCSGLCSVPLGYSASCVQRYVQKRLVALESAGQNLQTDVFWFPSCCVCTFTNS